MARVSHLVGALARSVLGASLSVVSVEMVGSFPMVLRAAISASGLPLERIQYRLRLRDVHVSVPTLSNWQSGRRTPERVESRRAVAELEQVLRLAPGTLVTLLGPPRPRGRTATAPARPLAATWGPTGARLLSTLDTAADALLSRLSQHDTVVVDAAGRVVSVHTRHVFSALHDGATRWIDVWHHGAAPEPAVVTGLWRCRLDRARVDRRARLAAAELVLDTALPLGSTAVAEYVVAFGDSGGPAGRFFRRFSLPVRAYVLEIRFASATPARCRRGGAGDLLTPSRSGAVTVVESDVTGLVDVSWEM
ncbi:hypothetical protein GCM10027436_40080 [Actinophytocola sediminis]